MSANPTSEEIMEAIEESGYLMEQQVATQLENLGFHVKTNVPFEDQEEKKSREIDVTAIKRVAINNEAKTAAFVELIVECKNSNNPYVFIERRKNEVDRRSDPPHIRYPVSYQMEKQTGPGIKALRDLSGFVHLGFADVHYGYLSSMKAVQFCRIDRNGKKWNANHGGLYDAIFYPIAKAVLARISELPKVSVKGDWAYLWFVFPLVVTSGSLFSIDSTRQNPIPKDEYWVRFTRELKSGKLSGQYALDFVRKDRLEDFVRDCIEPLANRATELVEKHSGYLLQATLDWID